MINISGYLGFNQRWPPFKKKRKEEVLKIEASQWVHTQVLFQDCAPKKKKLFKDQTHGVPNIQSFFGKRNVLSYFFYFWSSCNRLSFCRDNHHRHPYIPVPTVEAFDDDSLDHMKRQYILWMLILQFTWCLRDLNHYQQPVIKFKVSGIWMFLICVSKNIPTFVNPTIRYYYFSLNNHWL